MNAGEASRRALEILRTALDLDEDARPAYLMDTCGGDETLRCEVEELLAADRAAGKFLEVPLGRMAAPLFADLHAETGGGGPAALGPGARVGPWRILSELGRGGMGVVWLAERADGAYEQKAALKVVKRGMDTDEVLRRFRAERQILAQLQHPGIARLLDGGATANGLPYLAMVHVEGRPITGYCDDERLSVADRLRLFLSVCDAVGYAHRTLVVHRDIKPSNILVTAEGGIRLLDFGIAKLLGEASAGQVVTHVGARLFTPEYAAPEQRRGKAVTTLTDVYALGMVLHELLVGCRPVGRDLDPEGFDQITRPSFLFRRAAPGPHTNGARDGWTALEAARLRGTTRDGLRRHLSGDLDTIVLRALHPDPECRYPSAEALALDVQRHLDGRPVGARRDSPVYRGRKFVGRHRVGVAATTLVALALLAGIAGTAWQARVASEQAARATAATEFLVGLFRETSPEQARGENLTAREILDRGVKRIDSDLSVRPELHAEMLGVVGDLYRELGLYDDAEPLLRRALREERNLHGESDARVAGMLRLWGVLLWERGKYEDAEGVHREVLRMRQRIAVPRDSSIAESLTDLGNVLSDLGRYGESEKLHRRALTLDRHLFGAEHPRVAADLGNLAIVLWYQDRNEEAEPLYREALRQRERLLGENHPEVAQSLHALATFLSDAGRYREAEKLFDRALALRRKLFGPNHPVVAYTLDNLAILYERQGRYDRAEPLLREAVTIRQDALGANHPELATAYNNLAVLQYRRGEYEDAATYLKKALGIWNVEFGHEHPSVASGLNNLGAILREKGDLEAAGPLLLEALRIRRATLGDYHAAVAQSYNNLGLLALKKRDFTAADTLLAEALRRSRAAYPRGHPRIAEVLVGLGRLRAREGRAAEAEPLLASALEIRRASFSVDDWRTAEAAALLGRSLAALGRPAEAEPLLRSGVDGLSDRLASADDVRATLTSLIESCEALGMRAEAARYRRRLAALGAG